MSKNIDNMLVASIFFLSPRERGLREVAREANVSPMTASAHLRALVAQNILRQERVRNNLLFQPADTDAFRREKRLWNIARVLRSDLLDVLNTELHHPTIVLFGSVARGENTEQSDVDVFIITERKSEPNLSKFRKLFNAEIHTFVHTKQEFKKLTKTNPGLVNNVLNGVVLSGYLEVL